MIVGSTRIPTDKAAVINLLNHLKTKEYDTENGERRDNQNIFFLDKYGNKIENPDLVNRFFEGILQLSKSHGDTYAIRHVWINSKQRLSKIEHAQVISAFEKEFRINPDSHFKMRVVHQKPLTGGGYDIHEHVVYSERGCLHDLKPGFTRTGKTTKAKETSLIDDKERKIRQEKVARISEVYFEHEITLGKHNSRVLEMIYEGLNQAQKRQNLDANHSLKVIYEKLLDKFRDKLVENSQSHEEAIEIRERFLQAKKMNPRKALGNIFVRQKTARARYARSDYQKAKKQGFGVQFKEAIVQAEMLWKNYDSSIGFESYLNENRFFMEKKTDLTSKGPVYCLYYDLKDGNGKEHRIKLGSAVGIFGNKLKYIEKRLEYVPTLDAESRYLQGMTELEKGQVELILKHELQSYEAPKAIKHISKNVRKRFLNKVSSKDKGKMPEA